MNSKGSICTTLLLVDDDTVQLDLRVQVLKMSGFTVLATTSPAEAISIIAPKSRPRVDLAVLDYEMPVMNGCVLATYLRASYPELKIILHSGAIDVAENQISSVNSFVAKGEGVAQLLQQIAALLGNKAEAAHSAISSGACRCATPGSF